MLKTIMADTGDKPDTATKQVKHSFDSLNNNRIGDDNQEIIDLFDAHLCSGGVR